MAQKKKRPKWLKWVILAACIVVAVALVLLLMRACAPNTADSTSFTKAAAAKGTVEVNVVADGNLTSDAVTVNATMNGFISSIVKSGAQVKKGDTLAVIAQNPDEVTSAQAEYDIAVRALDRMREKPAMPSLVTASSDGRVSQVKVKEDDDAGSICQQYGQLMIITSGIKVALPDGATTAGKSLKIKVGSNSYSARAQMVDGKPYAVCTDHNPKLNQDATVYLKNTKIASGKVEAYITEPVTGMGTVKDVYVDEGDTVDKGERLVMLEGSSRSRDIADQEAKVMGLKAKLDDVKGDGKGTITADMDGWASEIKAAVGDSAVKDQPLFTLHPSMLEAVVDAGEIDVVKLKAGQSATVTLDALPDKTYTGTVEYVSGTGSKNGDTVNYEVRVSINDPAGLLPGMSCQVNILVDKKDNVLRIPTDALLDAPDGGKMVLVATGDASKIQNWNAQASSTVNFSGANMFGGGQRGGNGNIPQAEQRSVSVGLVNEYWAEITAGVNEGETVLIPIRNSSSLMNMFMGGGRNQGGQNQNDPSNTQSSPAEGTGK